MASKFDDETKDGIKITYMRDGDGNVRTDAKGRTMKSYTWRYRDAEGKSRQITRRNLAEVREKRNEIRQSLDAGTYVDPRKGKILVADYVGQWLERVKPMMDDTTWSTHEKRARNHIIPQLGHLRMNQMDADAYGAFQAYLCGNGRSLTTVRVYLATLNKIIDAALSSGVLSTDPRIGVEKIKVDWFKKKIPFDEHEVTAIKNDATDDLYRLIEVLLGTGMRISEAMALDMAQLDLTEEDEETLHVDRQLSKDTDGNTILKEPKSVKGDRTIPLPTWAVAAIKEQLKQRPPVPVTMQFKHRDKKITAVTARLIFHDGAGNPLKYWQLKEHWDKVIKAAGVQPKGEEGAGFHRIRHTYAADLIRHGMDLYLVSRLMGHSTIKVTEKFYAHLNPTTLEGARHALNNLHRPRRHLTAVRTA